MKTNLIFLLLCALSLQSLAQQSSTTVNDPRFKGLDTAFQHVLKTWHAAGFAVAVIEKNKVVYAKGFGYRDIAGKLPVTPNTLFAIGSCTKAFTATLIGKLQQDGKLDIDKPVNNYLPGLKFYNDAMTNTITLRDMMSHRTGLPRHDLSWYFFNTPSTDSLVQRVQYMEPTFGIRQKWQYNNFMFAAQGDVVQHLSGKSWQENIREKFFVPLGMSRSDLSIPELEKTDDVATGYGLKKDAIIFSTLPSRNGIAVKFRKGATGKAIVIIYDNDKNVLRKDILSDEKSLEKGYILTSLENGDYTVEVTLNQSVMKKAIHVYMEGQVKTFLIKS